MIITKTPFRISFFGGGTDYPIWFNENGGEVLSVTINKYCYIQLRSLTAIRDYNYRIIYSIIETVDDIKNIRHPAVKSVYKNMEFYEPSEIHHDADVSSKCGLGSSSSFVVGLIKAIYEFRGKHINNMELAKKAIHVEQNVLKESVGSQDQVAAAFGGLNNIKFDKYNNINVIPIGILPERLNQLENSMCIIYTGLTRYATEIASEQIKQTKNKIYELSVIGDLVKEGLSILYSESDLSLFGKLLNETWLIKKGLTDLISSKMIDDIYDAGIRNGAVGGKLLGAGGGGFILFYVHPEKKNDFIEKMRPLLHLPVKFSFGGSTTIFHQYD